MTEEEKVAALTVELMAGERVTVCMERAGAFTIIAALQLAHRHPRLGDWQRKTIRSFVEYISEALGDAPVARSIIEDGWKPDMDHS